MVYILLDKRTFATKLKYMVFITNYFGGDLFVKELDTAFRIPEEAYYGLNNNAVCTKKQANPVF